jgi:hypothetical protein
MKRLLVMALSSLLALPACVTDELSPEEIEGVEAALDDRFEPDLSCHVPDFGGKSIVSGTMGSDGWCCGVTLCSDRESCGEDYGKFVEACADCGFFDCHSGSSSEPDGGSGGGSGPIGGWGTIPPIYNPGGGANAP